MQVESSFVRCGDQIACVAMTSLELTAASAPESWPSAADVMVLFVTANNQVLWSSLSGVFLSDASGKILWQREHLLNTTEIEQRFRTVFDPDRRYFVAPIATQRAGHVIACEIYLTPEEAHHLIDTACVRRSTKGTEPSSTPIGLLEYDEERLLRQLWMSSTNSRLWTYDGELYKQDVSDDTFVPWPLDFDRIVGVK